jgi:hypothetical protein
MSLIDLEDFREILGVGEIYADSLLESAMESAENLILGFLLFHRASIVAVNIRSNVATFETRSPHGYVIGQQVTISNVGNPFDGTHNYPRRGIHIPGIDYQCGHLAPIKHSRRRLHTSGTI